LLTRDDIVQSNQPSLADERRITGEIGFHTLVAMVAIDKKKIEHLAAEELLDPLKSCHSL
jgi:hypothetical protein